MTESAMMEPKLLEARWQGDAIQLRLHIPAGLSWFDGHFADVPLLPGVVQTNWAVQFGRRYFSLPPQFCYLSNIKFMRFILPDAEIELHLSYQPVKSELVFSYRVANSVYASGRIGFGPGLDVGSAA